MSLENQQREEIKSTDIVAAKGNVASLCPNKKLEIGCSLFYSAIQTCFEKSPPPVYQIVHESIPEGRTVFQNFLIGDLFPMKSTWTSTRRVKILPVNEEIMKNIASFLSLKKIDQVKEVVECYKDSLKDFLEIRFSLVKRMFPNVEHEATDIGNATPEIKPNKSPLAKVDAYPVKILQELVLIAFERCQSFGKELNKDLEDLTHRSAYKSSLSRYLSIWETYFLSALEINTHLAALNDVINEATKVLLPNLPSKVPSFSIWRLLVGAFKSFCYMPLRQSLRAGCLRLLKEFSLNWIASKAKSEAIKMSEAEVLAYIKGEKKKLINYDDAALADCAFEDILLCKKVVQSLIDMSLNEINVHFLNLKSLDLKVCKDMCKPLADQIKELCQEAMLKFGKTKNLVELLESELNLLKSIFPPCLWDDLEITIREAVLSCLKEELGAIALKFSQLSEGEKKSISIQDHSEDRHVVPVVQQLKDQVGKPMLKQSEQKIFVSYLFNCNNLLYNQYVEQRVALNVAKMKEQSVEDIEIKIKNRCLGIQMNEEAFNYYMLCGMNQAELEKLSMK